MTVMDGPSDYRAVDKCYEELGCFLASLKDGNRRVRELEKKSDHNFRVAKDLESQLQEAEAKLSDAQDVATELRKRNGKLEAMLAHEGTQDMGPGHVAVDRAIAELCGYINELRRRDDRRVELEEENKELRRRLDTLREEFKRT